MIKFNELRQIHLEISNNCQASCPMCVRNHHGGIDNPLLRINNWTLEQFKNIISHEVLNQIDDIYFCGNYGDPLMNDQLIDMCRYATEYKPDIYIRIHTNGGIRNTKYWEELVSALPKKHLVVFAIDGLEDTNHIYRIGTSFKKIIENAKSFINKGGIAEWAYIIFKHNEHQTIAAEQLAKSIGFKNFIKKNSNRFMLEDTFDVYDKNKNVIYKLEPPTENKVVFFDKNIINTYREVAKHSEIKCMAIEQREVYIDCFGNLYPCCFIAMIPYNYYSKDNIIANIRDEILEQFNNLMHELGTTNCNTNSIKDIIDSEAYQTVWDKYWSDPKLLTCVRTCGTNKFSKPKDQFIERNNVN